MLKNAYSRDISLDLKKDNPIEICIRHSPGVDFVRITQDNDEIFLLASEIPKLIQALQDFQEGVGCD
jgi:hypothetical protein